MNSFFKILVFKFLIIFCFACKSNEQAIGLVILKSEKPIILKYNKQYKKIVKIQVPISIRVTNNSFKKRIFNSVKYQYADYRKGIGTIMYINKNNNLIRIKNNRKIEIAPNSKNEYLLYSNHRLDSSSSIQLQFKSYINKIQTLNQDSLVIGTVSEFKRTHSYLFKNLTDKDSISIRFLNPKNKESLGEIIKKPIEY